MERKTAVITGATSGIGKAFAERFAGMGYDLLITGRRKKVIDAVAADIARRHGVAVRVVLAELSRELDVRSVLRTIRREKRVDALVNNAGYGIESVFHAGRIEEHLGMVKVHVDAPLRFIHAVLAGMLERRSGIIINVSSLGAFLPAPINGIYGGTKSFLNIFTESIHLEVRGRGVRVQSLCPGFTRTDFHNKMGVEEKIHERVAYWAAPGEVVDYSFRCLSKGRVVCIPGWRNRLFYHVAVNLPRSWYYWITSRISREYSERV